ncbi:hypothetical protein D3C71_1442850 [compost metagenome]
MFAEVGPFASRSGLLRCATRLCRELRSGSPGSRLFAPAGGRRALRPPLHIWRLRPSGFRLPMLLLGWRQSGYVVRRGCHSTAGLPTRMRPATDYPDWRLLQLAVGVHFAGPIRGDRSQTAPNSRSGDYRVDADDHAWSTPHVVHTRCRSVHW